MRAKPLAWPGGNRYSIVSMWPAQYLNKPEYFFRPSQIIRRWLYRPSSDDETVWLRLLWGAELGIRPGDIIGHILGRMGVYDLAVSEVLWRLVEAGESAVDAGANIGYMSSLLAHRVGREGAVWSFEPHPEIFRQLSASVARWPTAPQIHLHQAGLSHSAGTASLVETDEFQVNRGSGQLDLAGNAADQNPHRFRRAISVPLVRLDEVLPPDIRLGVMKIDVEGHELEVLRGATGLLGRRAIRDIVFEEHSAYPTPVTTFLEANGFAVHRIIKGFMGPRLQLPRVAVAGPLWGPPNYLATLDSPRALARLAPGGWWVLKA